MTFVPIGPGQARCWRVVRYLRRSYTEWTADLTNGRPGIPYLRWRSYDDRDAMYLLCDLWKMPKEG